MASITWKIQDLFTGTGHRRIRKLIKTHKQQFNQTEEELVSVVTQDIRHRLVQDHMSPLFSVCDLLDYSKHKLHKHPERCKFLMLETVDIMATHRIPSRTVLRAVLKLLVQFTGDIHREVMFFEFSTIPAQSIPQEHQEEISKKRDYILSNVAGWKTRWKLLDQEEQTQSSFYLELPIHRIGRDDRGSHSLMVEALFHLRSASLVLSLLQNGVFPTAVFLWPITVLAEIKLTTHKQLDPESFEALSLCYFCRARRNFTVHVVEDGPKDFGAMVKGSEYDNVLLISQNVLKLIPEDRFRVPANLKHQCRLFIRDILLQRDRLPLGIDNLMLPYSMQLYLNLLTD